MPAGLVPASGPARAVYVRGGFVDGGELYLGGSEGPQHVLRLALAAAAEQREVS